MRRRSAFFSRACLALMLLASALGVAQASRAPSAELRFKVTLAPDSITVGDPISLRIEAEAPNAATLLLPQFADSIGPFVVLSADPIVRANRAGRALLTQEVKVTLFAPGRFEFPPLPLLWVRGADDTLVANSNATPVRVGSLLDAELKKSAKGGPAKALDLSFLRGVKGVVSLGPERWWFWLAGGLLVAAIAFLLWRRFGRRAAAVFVPPPPPPVAPEVAFERGLDALLAGELLGRPDLKDFYVELSRLLRVYLEDRFRWQAVEGTRSEILDEAARAGFSLDDQRWLGTWLEAGDLVKFAKGERLLEEARQDAESARGWVRRIALEALDRTRGTLPAAELPPPTPASPTAEVTR